MMLSRSEAKVFSKDLYNAVKALCVQYGMDVHSARFVYSPDNATFKVEMVTKGVTKEELSILLW